ncbi:helix-turn-helix transcriptional regulator [Schlesneria paludicola]|uniref:helix-turn-helix transcriptional regulator n=1 Tax=Schlesneria paludicola TaxID=360056 RepID=UPI00029A10C7|nr:helix-turn-helix domain-containing protein [Schlesneria paludicola]
MTTIKVQVEVTIDEDAINSFAELLAPAIKQAIFTQEELKMAARLRSSQNALFAGQKLPEHQGLLLTSKETATLLRVSERTLYSMHTTGQMPPPIRIGAAIRWSLDAVQKWIEAGCPTVEAPKK